MRTLTISKDSLFSRFFMWAWKANPEDLNVCKLFWGTILFPLAFTSFTKAYKFISRITFFYMVGIVLCISMGWWHAMKIYFFFGIVSIIIDCTISYIITRRSESSDEKRDRKAHILSEITKRGSIVVEKILHYIIIPVFGQYYDGVVNSCTSKRINGLLTVISAYFRAAKQRYCPAIRVI